MPRKRSGSISVEILDIDYFKQYNDNYGHQKGDKCIKKVADIIVKSKSKGKVFPARYGGDEFVIIYEGLSRSEVEKIAYDIKKRIEDEAIEHEFSKADDIVTVSQGVCCGFPKVGQKVEDYLHKADEFLYKAKDVSRNTVYIGNFEE